MSESVRNLPDVVGLRDSGSARACDLVVEQLQSLIVDGTLAPNAQLPAERDLAVRFQTSRATISQAVRVLSALGLVEIHHGSGVYVSPDPGRLLRQSIDLLLRLDRSGMIQLAELRGWLELAAVQKAAGTRTDDDLQEMDRCLEALDAERTDVEAWLSHDVAFHEAILRATRNEPLVGILSSVIQLMRDGRSAEFRAAGELPAWFTSSELQELVALHRDIATAIRDQDADRAHALAVQHQTMLLDHIAETDPWPAPRAPT